MNIILCFSMTLSLLLAKSQSEAMPGEPPAALHVTAVYDVDEVRIETLDDDRHQGRGKNATGSSSRHSGKKDLDMIAGSAGGSGGVVPKKGVEEKYVKNSKVSGRKGVGEAPTSVVNGNVEEKPVVDKSEAAPAASDGNNANQAKDLDKKGDPKRQKANDKGVTLMIVGIVFAVIVVSTLLFVGFHRMEAVRRRRREYRSMNDFLIDGMYDNL